MTGNTSDFTDEGCHIGRSEVGHYGFCIKHGCFCDTAGFHLIQSDNSRDNPTTKNYNYMAAGLENVWRGLFGAACTEEFR
jgi:hypothetical protein